MPGGGRGSGTRGGLSHGIALPPDCVRILDGTQTPGDLTGGGDPSVFRHGNQWTMFFAAAYAADSTIPLFQATVPVNTDVDGTTWTIDETPLFTLTAGQFDEHNAEVPSYVEGPRGVRRVYYAGSNGSGTVGTDPYVISFAQDVAGTWTRHGSPVITGTASWELVTTKSFVSEPAVIFDPESDRYHCWYTAGSITIGYQNSKDGINWENKRQFYSTEGISWSPTVYKVGNHWEMVTASFSHNAVPSPTHGLYRAKCKTPSGNIDDWGDFQLIHQRGDRQSWHADWIYGACAAQRANGDLVMFFTGRDPTNLGTAPHIGRFILPPLGD